MHRFRKKQDLEKQRLGEAEPSVDANSNNSSTFTQQAELPEDFRISLILPALTKRFSVLRRGEVQPASDTTTAQTENSSATTTATSANQDLGTNNNSSVATNSNRSENSSNKNTSPTSAPNVSSTKATVSSMSTPNRRVWERSTQKKPFTLSQNSDYSTLSTSHSPPSNGIEFNEDDATSVSSMNSSTPPTSVTTSIPSTHNDSSTRKLYGSGSPILTTTGGGEVKSEFVKQKPFDVRQQQVQLTQKDFNISSSNNDNNENDDSREISMTKKESGQSPLSEAVTSKLDLGVKKRLSGPLDHPGKYRPAPPKTKRPSISRLPGESWEIGFTLPKSTAIPGRSEKLSQTPPPGFIQTTPAFSSASSTPPRASNSDPTPLSPLDKLSQGLISLSLQQSVVSSTTQPLPIRPAIDRSNTFTSSKYSTSSHAYSITNLSQTSIDSSDDDYSPYRSINFLSTNEPLQMEQGLSTNDQNVSTSPSNSHSTSLISDFSSVRSSDDRYSTGSSIGKSLQRIKTSAPPPKRALTVVETRTSQTNGISTSPPPQLQKEYKPAGRSTKQAPPKPQPPPVSLTDTLIATGQADVANQVLVMRRALASSQEQLLTHPPILQFDKQPLRRPSKNIGIRDISTPSLISSSSNVKGIPIVRLGRDELGSQNNARRNFSLRDSETSLSKISRKLRDVFTSDNESHKFMKKTKSTYDTSSQNSPPENLRKFVSDENLRYRYMSPSKSQNINDTRRTKSTKARGFDNNNSREAAFNSSAFTVNNFNNINTAKGNLQEGLQNSRSKSSVTFPEIGNNNRWVVSESELVNDSTYKKRLKKQESMERTSPLYDIDGIKRHAEMVTKYSSSKKADGKSRTSSQSEQSGTYSGRESSSTGSATDKKVSRDLWIGDDEMSQQVDTSPTALLPPKLNIDTQKNAQLNVPSAKGNGQLGSDVVGSPTSAYSPTSLLPPHNDASFEKNTPPPIAPRNPLRGLNNPHQTKQQQQQLSYGNGSFKRKGSMNSNNSSSNTSDGSTSKRDSKDSRSSRTSSRFLSLFNNHSPNRLSSNNVDKKQANDDSKKSRNKVVRRTIIVTKSSLLPPLPDEPSEPPTPSTPASIKVASRIGRQPSLRKKIEVDGTVGASSDGRKWHLSKIDGDESRDSSSQETGNNTNGDKISESNSDVDSNENGSRSNISEPKSSEFLAVPSRKLSLNRPPTPIPSPGTRKSAMELPYGIPIPPIPNKNEGFLSLEPPTVNKRVSGASMTSSFSSGSRKRKSQGGKSVYSAYGESLYDYYDYSDQEGADDEREESEGETRRQKRETEIIDPEQMAELPRSHEGAAILPIKVQDETLVEELEQEQHLEVLELDDGSFIWKVVKGLRENDVKDRCSYFYNAGEEEVYDDSNTWSREFFRSEDYDDDGNRTDDLMYSPLHLPGVRPHQSSELSRSPNRMLHGKRTNSVGSVSSHEDGTNIIPRTSVYFAKDVPLPRLLAEMTKGLGSADFEGGMDGYIYGGEIALGGTGVIGSTTVEEKLEQVMRDLGVNDGEQFTQ